MKSISKRLGLNYEVLKKDMDDPKIIESIERNLSLATAIGVNGTPAYLVGEQFIPGAIDAVALAKIVADERKKSSNPGGKTSEKLSKIRSPVNFGGGKSSL